MAFIPLDKSVLPPRQWALVGHPGSGKSTFAAQMRTPMLIVDADQRFSEVLGQVAGDVFKLSETPADNVNGETIARLINENMPGAGVNTIVIDSLTSILSPLVVQAILDNEAGKHRNRVAPFKSKALIMRLLQETITEWGCDVLWIYHLRSGLDSQANQVESQSISAVELARLRPALNVQLSIVEDNARRGVHVDWARRGRAGQTLWDSSDRWLGMPERIEAAVYGGLTPAHMDELAEAAPTSFSGPADAIAWGYEQGCFNDAVHAANAYEKCKRQGLPATAGALWQLWIADIERRRAEAKPSHNQEKHP